MSRQHIIVCEGYDDRAFWAGLLVRLGLRDPTVGHERGRRPRVNDPWGRPVVGGQFAFATAAGTFVRLQPCDGGGNVLATAAAYLDGHATRPVGRIVLNLDADRDAGADGGPDSLAAVHNFVERRGGQVSGDGTGTIDGALVVPVIWACEDGPETPGVPRKQTLERLVCAAIAATHPDRAPSVERWLADPPVSAPVTHKHYSLSYLAKWYAEHGADDFFRALWRDPAVAGELERRLAARGVWQHLLALAQD